MLGRGAAIVWRGLERRETMNCNCNTANNVGVRAPSIRQQQKLSVDVEYGEYQTNIMISLTRPPARPSLLLLLPLPWSSSQLLGRKGGAKLNREGGERVNATINTLERQRG